MPTEYILCSSLHKPNILYIQNVPMKWHGSEVRGANLSEIEGHIIVDGLRFYLGHMIAQS